MTRVLFVCLGNICRSPMAEGLMRKRVAERDLGGRFEIDSAGTGAWHAGEPPDPRTIAVLRRVGAPVVGTARRVRDVDFTHFDTILAMDRANLRELRARCPEAHAHKLALMLGDTDVPDPYYGGGDGFERVRALLDAALDGWLDAWLDAAD